MSFSNYGLDVEFVTRLLQNDIGDCAEMKMLKRKVGTRHSARGGERLSIYFLEIGAVSRGSKVVYDRAHSSFSSIEPGMFNWEEILKDADWFHWTGIMPTGGITPDLGNLEKWFESGVTCVGMGSKLISMEIIKNEDFKELSKKVATTLEIIKVCRKQ